MSLRDIGTDLGVRYIVEGSVRRVNNHVRITVQLIDAASDAHLWASNYDRELVDVFAVQSEVANAITNSLHLEIQPETIGTLDEMPTRSVKAYDLYMKASSIDRSEPESEAALLRQRELLEAAVAEDPGFVEAWAALNEILDFSARNILQLEWFGENQAERDASFAEIRQAAQRALEMAVTLNPDNVMSLLAQASDYVREQESRKFQLERKQFIDRALELDPDNAVAWLVLGWWYRLSEDDLIGRYLWSQVDYIAAKKLGNDPDEVKTAAQDMLDAYRRFDKPDDALGSIARYPMSVAFVELHEEEADLLRESLNSADDEQLFSRMSGPFFALSIVDTDTAVQRALDRKAQHPSWYGTDWMATLHVSSRHLLVHPKMQAFYVEEGKWLEYLAARVPEYAKYKQQ